MVHARTPSPRCPSSSFKPRSPADDANVDLAGPHKTVLTVVAVGTNVESNPYNLLVGGSGYRTL